MQAQRIALRLVCRMASTFLVTVRCRTGSRPVDPRRSGCSAALLRTRCGMRRARAVTSRAPMQLGELVRARAKSTAFATTRARAQRHERVRRDRGTLGHRLCARASTPIDGPPASRRCRPARFWTYEPLSRAVRGKARDVAVVGAAPTRLNRRREANDDVHRISEISSTSSTTFYREDEESRECPVGRTLLSGTAIEVPNTRRKVRAEASGNLASGVHMSPRLPATGRAIPYMAACVALPTCRGL